jgi:NAD(P)-dependent dehydrogenase (short-subunit alcohol dehydrogenase family)
MDIRPSNKSIDWAAAEPAGTSLVSGLFDLGGRTALVTGSSRGIGRDIAEALAAHGANVVISSRKQEACDAVAAAINAQRGGRAIAVAASIASKPDLERLAASAADAFGRIDILVCNAATNPYHGPMLGISDEQFEKILRNNILASHWLAQLAVPAMKGRRDGSIILLSSIGGYRGSPVIGAYNLSKAADLQLARNLAVELGSYNIRVNCIVPGLIRTDFARALWEDEVNLAKALQGTPLRRIGEPGDIGGVAVFLASAAARYVTGQAIVVDGGATVTVGGI